MARAFSSGNYLATGSSSNVQGQVNKSWHVWVNPSSLAASYNSPMGYDAGGSGGGAVGQTTLYVKSTGALAVFPAYDPATTGTISTNTWSAIGFSYLNSSGAVRTYINGSFDTNNTGSSLAAGSLCNFNIGVTSNGTTFPFPGSIAEAAVWSVVLTDAEFAALGKGARAYTIRPLSLVAYWPIDGLQSPEPDLSGNKNNGTLNGTPTLAFGAPFMQFTPRSPHLIVPVAAAAGGPGFIAARALAANLVYEGFA